MKYEKHVILDWKNGIHLDNYFKGEYEDIAERLFNGDHVNVMADIEPDTRVKITFMIETLEEGEEV